MDAILGGLSPAEFWTGLGKIIWINILLSGDNAVVIALACRGLPPHQRKMGILLGAGAAIGLRVIFTLMITYLLDVPWLKAIGGVLLLWIAYKLLTQEEASEDGVHASADLWGAVRTIAVADVVMSLDNVLAIAGAAKGNMPLIVLGLLISIPMIIAGATLLTTILQKYPFLVWAGAALLGWIAGELIATDPATAGFVANLAKSLGLTVGQGKLACEVIGALIVLLLGLVFRKKHAHAH